MVLVLLFGLGFERVYGNKFGINFGGDKFGGVLGKFGINFGCVRFEGVLGEKLGSILSVKHFGDVSGKKLRLILGLILDVADLRDALKPSLGLTLGEIDLG